MSPHRSRRLHPAGQTIYRIREAAHDVIAESAVVFFESYQRAYSAGKAGRK